MMFGRRLWVALAFAALIGMFWLDWKFPTAMFYSPYAHNQTISRMLLSKKVTELSLSGIVATTTIVVLYLKQSGTTEKLLISAAFGAGVAFWLHRDLLYMLLH